MNMSEPQRLEEKWSSLRVICPICGAKVGERCRPYVFYHSQRLKLAMAASAHTEEEGEG